MCEYCEDEKSLYKNTKCVIVGHLRFLRVCKKKPYLSISTNESSGGGQHYVPINNCPMCGRYLKEDSMRADEPIRFYMYGTGMSQLADYINQLRYERLMAKCFRFHEMQVKSHEPFTCWIKDTKSDYDVYVQCERIAEALEARAMRIKKGM